MRLTYDEAKENGCESRRLYKQRFLTHRIQSHCTFLSVDQRLQATDYFAISNLNLGRLRNLRKPEMEERILTRFETASSTSTRVVK
ncbi:hypothetical protein TNCT_366611 [Trichonephila clavata]|uniref:Uncharacterized protein n=1 Tax=Trichonephila clavata TaxID=2740835 RepID=A0A8X6J501_TRICU|nr:hypothetical protein TNCT_366611 [Trichonephila clavata]